MAAINCAECDAERNEGMPWFRLFIPDTDIELCLCSIECVLAAAWAVKVSRLKLSKSNLDAIPAIDRWLNGSPT